MKLWKLERLVDYDTWDITLGLVVRADTEEKAREMAQETQGGYDSDKDLWLNPAKSSCEVLSARGKSEVIIVDFKAG